MSRAAGPRIGILPGAKGTPRQRGTLGAPGWGGGYLEVPGQDGGYISVKHMFVKFRNHMASGAGLGKGIF